ncbi:hypothetical protein F0L68_03860 [Solihabitans fulvus]|uniref:Uncharacterized protein n=1 Tax=Solihabitans fulvus TaxID=1892852 RepID=A0A5B2XPP8_9PSEU|nr:DUF6880 family protein [Solihabitans fulvus]KAA2265717.1 hypothetical protein F0L68_03860 [Solihabitans fulvus]
MPGDEQQRGKDVALPHDAVAKALSTVDAEWPVRLAELTSAAAALEQLARTEPTGDVAALAEQVIEAISAAARTATQRAHELTDLAQRTLRAHAEVCRRASGDPHRLADWLLNLQLAYPEGPEVQLADYADALGEDGLDRYRNLAREWFAELPTVEFGETGRYDRHRWALLRIMEEVAEYSRDVDLQILVLSKDLSSGWHYLQVATVLQEAGRSGEALDWVQRGLAATGGRGAAPRLIDLAVDECLRMGWFDRAIELRTRAFRDQPRLDTYLRLRALAEHADDWPDRRAEVLRWLGDCPPERQMVRNSVLVRILLWEGEQEAAWRAATERGCTDEVWSALAQARAEEHPGDAITVYRGILDQQLSVHTELDHEDVAAMLEQLRALFHRTGKPDDFARYLDGVKSRHAADRRLLDELTRRGL